jgi:signal transduction histidine kinase
VTEQMRRFTADASHELRTPLAAVRGEAQVTLSRDRTGAEYRESVEVMLEEAVRMGRIVDDMLTLARADAGELPLERAPVYLDEVVADATRTARPLAEQRGIALDVEPSPEAVEIVGDEDLLRRAVLNLVDNAIKYTEPGGSVRARAVCDGHEARVEVEDTGQGITPADRERIFDRFYRVDKARSRDAGGAGLGLSIVRWAAEAHGGRVDLASEPGTGSRFALVIPRPR